VSELTDEELMAKVHAAVARTRAERGIDRYHDSGADSGSLAEDEERDLSRRPE
jgi:hypothetical protein